MKHIAYIFFNIFYELKRNGSRQAGRQQVIYKFVKKRSAFLALLLPGNLLPLPHTHTIHVSIFLSPPAVAINLTEMQPLGYFKPFPQAKMLSPVEVRWGVGGEGREGDAAGSHCRFSHFSA